MKNQTDLQSLFTGFWRRLTAVIVVLVGLVSIGSFLFRISCVTAVDNYELAFNYNWWTGKIEKLDRAGWIIRWPIVNSVHTIDLRPYQISITADIQKNVSGSSSDRGIGARVLNAKLVRFNPEGLDTFIEWHGRRAGNNTRQMLEILKAYAFDSEGGRGCPFLTVSGVVTPNQNMQAVNNTPPR